MKTNEGLVDYCKKQLGLPYWWGTTGEIATKSLYEYKKTQYPSQYLANDFKNQFGKRVHDCVGLIKGYMLLDENGKRNFDTATFNKYDKDVSGMLGNCSEIGAITTMPDIPGVLVFMKGHVGIYIGNGEVIEARGHAYGVVQTKLKDRPWDTYGKLSWIKYKEDDEMIDGKIVEMLNRLCDKYTPEILEKAISRLADTFIDDGQPAPWAHKEVEEARALRLTDATNPEMFTTRQEAMIMCLRAYKKAKGD